VLTAEIIPAIDTPEPLVTYHVLAAFLQRMFGATPQRPKRLTSALRAGMAVDKTLIEESPCPKCGALACQYEPWFQGTRRTLYFTAVAVCQQCSTARELL
jgi:hypothetical protein